MLFGDRKEKDIENIGEGATRRNLVIGEKIQLSEIEIKAGSLIPEHSHPNEQASYVLKGKFETIIGEEKGIVCKGYWVNIPSNVPHSGTVIEDTIIIDVYSPPRDE